MIIMRRPRPTPMLKMFHVFSVSSPPNPSDLVVPWYEICSLLVIFFGFFSFFSPPPFQVYLTGPDYPFLALFPFGPLEHLPVNPRLPQIFPLVPFLTHLFSFFWLWGINPPPFSQTSHPPLSPHFFSWIVSPGILSLSGNPAKVHFQP